MTERLTQHHLTPRCIGKVWRINYKTINAPENKEWLPEDIHTEQDQVIPMLLERAKRQRDGGTVGVFDHHNEMLVYELGEPKLD